MLPILLASALTISSCYHLPVWEGDVVVHPLERESLAKCGTGALTAEGTKKLTRPPYLQSTTTTSTHVVFGATRGEVVLREPGAKPEDPARAVAGSDVGPGLLGARFDALESNHLYCYQVVDSGIALTELAPLTTAPPPGLDGEVSFVVVGDTGTGGAAAKAIAKRITEVPFDLLLFLGDIAYKSGTAAQLENNFFQVYDSVLRYVPAFPSIGNHERRTAKGKAYFDAFVLPDTERYYSFDWGDVHFTAIDTTHRDSAQLEWLKRDLASTKQPWKIVFGHHPMYTNSLRGPQRGIRKAYSKILTDAKVDIVLTGHEHQYERFRVANVNYIVSGGGGGRLTRFFGLHKSMKRASVHHFLAFEVDASQLVMRAIDIDGKEIEKLTLTKGEPTRPQSPIAPEKEVKPDEKLHDEPDDDVTR